MINKYQICIIALLTLTIAACSKNSNYLSGYKKNPLNEFEVATKAPLIVPPQFYLEPPRPNARDAFALTSSVEAQLIIFGKMQSTASTQSPLETALLVRANAIDSDGSIRETLDNEARGVVYVDAAVLKRFQKRVNDTLDAEAARQQQGDLPRAVPIQN